MAITHPFHSRKETARKVYHNNTACTEGNNIERFYLTPGRGVGRVLCDHCRRLMLLP